MALSYLKLMQDTKTAPRVLWCLNYCIAMRNIKELNNSKLYCYDQNDTTEAVFSFSLCSLNTIWAFIHSIYTLTTHYKDS